MIQGVRVFIRNLYSRYCFFLRSLSSLYALSGRMVYETYDTMFPHPQTLALVHVPSCSSVKFSLTGSRSAAAQVSYPITLYVLLVTFQSPRTNIEMNLIYIIWRPKNRLGMLSKGRQGCNLQCTNQVFFKGMMLVLSI